jgi:hypothetical protein
VAELRGVIRRLADDFNHLETIAGYSPVSLQDRLERIADEACIPRDWLEVERDEKSAERSEG